MVGVMKPITSPEYEPVQVPIAGRQRRT